MCEVEHSLSFMCCGNNHICINLRWDLFNARYYKYFLTCLPHRSKRKQENPVGYHKKCPTGYLFNCLTVVKVLIWQIQIFLIHIFKMFQCDGGSFSLISVKALCIMNFTQQWKLPWAQQWWSVCSCAHKKHCYSDLYHCGVVPGGSLSLTAG